MSKVVDLYDESEMLEESENKLEILENTAKEKGLF